MPKRTHTTPPAVQDVETATASVAQAKDDAKVLAARMRIWERRLVNPEARIGPNLQLKDDSFEIRWINTGRPGRFYNATAEQGWEPVRPAEVDGEITDLGLVDHKDGYVRRGPKGEEVLMKIPKAIFKKIQLRKAELLLKTLRNTRSNLAHAAARQFGTEQAADFVQGKGNIERDGTGGMVGRITGSVGETPA